MKQDCGTDLLLPLGWETQGSLHPNSEVSRASRPTNALKTAPQPSLQECSEPRLCGGGRALTVPP